MYQPTENDLLVPVPGFELKGHNKMLPLNLIDPGVARLVQNLNVRFGGYQARDGTSVVGTGTTSKLVYAADVILSTGVFMPTRWRVDGVDVFKAGAWVAATNTGGFTANAAYQFTATGWNDTVLFRCGNGKIFVLTYGSPDVVTEIAAAPTGAIHLATFGGRVVASLESNRIQWSKRASSTDWTALGSGFEDLLSAPGGRSDQQTAVVPVTDELAYVVRSSSVWQMSLTGNFDAPFAFSRLYTHVGSKYQATVVPIPRGFMAAGDRQIWMVTPEGANDVGKPIANDLELSENYMNYASAMYDPVFDQYRLTLPKSPGAATHYTARYDLGANAWTEDYHPFEIRSMASTLKANVDHPGDGIGALARSPGAIYSMAGGVAPWFVVRDDPTRSNEVLRDVNAAGTGETSGFRLETGDIRRGDDLQRKDFVEVIVWYTSEEPVNLVFDYSFDGGITWFTFSNFTVPAASRPTPVSIMQSFDRDFLQVAVWTASAKATKLIGLNVMLREGARITDAH
jgi:hypothetical protein